MRNPIFHKDPFIYDDPNTVLRSSTFRHYDYDTTVRFVQWVRPYKDLKVAGLRLFRSKL